MRGTRIYTQDLYLAKGEYARDAKTGIWYACCPIGHLANLANHSVIEHEDGTITVSPSILVSGYDYDLGRKTTWHGYLEQGIWREV